MRRPASSNSDSDADTIASLGESIEALQGEKYALAGQLTVHEAQMTAAQDNIDLLEQESRHLRAKMEDSELKNAKLGEALRQKHSELHAISNELVSLKAQYEDVFTQLQQSQSSAQQSEYELQAMQERMRELDAARLKEIEVYQVKVDEMEKMQNEQLEKLKESNEELTRKLAEAQKDVGLQVDEWKDKYNAERKKRRELELEQTFLEEENKSLKRDKQELENALPRVTPASMASHHQLGSHTPSSGKASSMKIMKPPNKATPSTPTMSRSPSGSLGTSSPVPLTPIGPSSSSLSRSPSGSTVPSGSVNGNGTSSHSPRSASSSTTPPLSPSHDEVAAVSSSSGSSATTTAPLPLASSASFSGLVQSPSGSSIAAKRKSGGIEDLADPQKSFSKALSHYNGDVRDKPADMNRQDSHHDPLAGIHVQSPVKQALSSASSVAAIDTAPRSESPRPRETVPLSSEVKLNQMKARVQSLETELKRTANERRDAMAEIADLKEQVDQLDRELHMKKEETEELRRSSQVSLDSVARSEALASQLAASRAHIQELETSKADIQAQLRQSEEQGLSRKLVTLESEHSKCASRIAQLQSDMEAQSTILQNVGDIARQKEQSLSQECRASEARLKESSAELAQVQASLQDSKRESTILETTIQSLRQELEARQAEATAEIERLRKEIESINGLHRQATAESTVAFETMIASLQEEISRNQQEIDDMRPTIANSPSLLAELESSQSLAQRLQSEALLQHGTIEKLQEQLATIKDEHQKEVSSLPEIQLRSVAETHASSESTISTLKKQVSDQLQELEDVRQRAAQVESSLKSDLESSNSIIDKLRKENASGMALCEELRSKLSEISSVHKQELDMLAEHHEQRLTLLTLEHGKVVSDLSTKYEESTASSKNQYEGALSEVKEELNIAKKREVDLEREMEQLRSSLEALQAKVSPDLESKDIDSGSDLELELEGQREATAKLSKALEAVQSAAAEAASAHQKLVSEKDERIVQCERDLAQRWTRIQELEAETDGLRKQLHSRNEFSLKMKDEAARAREQISQLFTDLEGPQIGDVDGEEPHDDNAEMQELRDQHLKEMDTLRAEWKASEEVAVKVAEALQEQVKTVSEELRTLKSEAARKDYAVQMAFAKTELERIQQDSLAEKQRYEAELEKLRLRAVEADQHVAMSMASCEEKDTQLKMSLEESTSQEQRIGTLQQEMEASARQKDETIATLKARIADLEMENSGKANELELFKRTAKSSEAIMEAMRTEQQKEQQETIAKDAQIAELHSQLADATAQCKVAKQHVEHMRATLKQVKEQAVGRLDMDPNWISDKSAEVSFLKQKIEELNAKHFEQQQKQRQERSGAPASPTSPGARHAASALSPPSSFDSTYAILAVTPIIVMAYLIFVHIAVYNPHVTFLS